MQQPARRAAHNQQPAVLVNQREARNYQRKASARASSAVRAPRCADHTATRTARAAISAARPSISNQREPRGPRSTTRGAGQPARNEQQPAHSGCYRTASAGASSAGARVALRGPHKYQRQCGLIRLASPMPKQTTCFNHDFFILVLLMMRAIKRRAPPRAVSLREPELPPGCCNHLPFARGSSAQDFVGENSYCFTPFPWRAVEPGAHSSHDGGGLPFRMQYITGLRDSRPKA